MHHLTRAVTALAFVALAHAPEGRAQTSPGPAPGPTTGRPTAPVTKVLALGTLTIRGAPDPAAMRQEARDTLDLHLSGAIEQWYFRPGDAGVVVILNAHDVASARAILERLPFVRDGVLSFEYVELAPLVPLRALLAPG
ncbi:hypothetical protein ACE7GA_25280 [Roseomonas sp. CCTCC AB2023176]|uniref:hypothetical protein n=1 Tax=Roseomonas sp. CCTCC AB2023176 TaxID=3342640 RepID=UPI0035DBE715